MKDVENPMSAQVRGLIRTALHRLLVVILVWLCGPLLGPPVPMPSWDFNRSESRTY